MLLHLPLELLRLALQHLLLPFLLGGLGAVALLLGQVLLALGEFVELLQASSISCALCSALVVGGLLGLVLILLGIELEIEEGGQIACRAAPRRLHPRRAPNAT